MSQNDVPTADLAHGRTVQRAKAVLRDTMGEPEMPWDVLEQQAREAAPEEPLVAQALRGLDDAVNTWWSLIYSDGTLDYLVSLFKKRHRKLAQAVDTEDIHAQAALLIRDFVVRYSPELGVPFRIYLTKYGVSRLMDALAPYAPAVKLSRARLRQRQVSRTADVQKLTFPPRAPYDPLAEHDEETSHYVPSRKDPRGVWVQEPTLLNPTPEGENHATPSDPTVSQSSVQGSSDPEGHQRVHPEQRGKACRG